MPAIPAVREVQPRLPGVSKIITIVIIIIIIILKRKRRNVLPQPNPPRPK